ncbi:MAG: rhomboid family intramembrane serine protease, partial [Myxococcaceae bacterium]
MLLLHPLGIEEREMDRVPWVSVSIAALCAVMFAVTWLIPSDPLGGGGLEALFGHWAEHPNLPLPAPLRDELPPEAWEQLEELHGRALEDNGPPAAEEQEQLDALLAEHQASSEGSLLRRLSLVPARGAAQW